MSQSNIEWTDWTDNPIGVKGSLSNFCVKVSPGCKNCYAEKMARRLSAISKDLTWKPYKATGEPPEMELRRHVLEGWRKMKKPRKIFVGSMTDIFASWVKYTWLIEILDTMIACPHLTFQILTKRSDRMKRVIDTYLSDKKLDCLPQNIWVGVSAESQEYLDRRLEHLLTIRCAIRFLSCEPLLGPLNLALDGTVPKDWGYGYKHVSDLLHWVIVGGESGPGARPMHPAWVREIRNQCIASQVPFFFKQWGGYADGSNWPATKSGPRTNHIVILNNGEYQDYNAFDLQRKHIAKWNDMQPTVMHKNKNKGFNAIDNTQHLVFPQYRFFLDLPDEYEVK